MHLGGICGQNNTNAKMSNCVVFDSNLKGYCPSASNSGDDNYGLLGGISALNRGLIENVIVKNTTLYLDVRGDGDGGLLEKDNKAYPRVYIGEILAENVAGTLKGYSYSDTDVSYYISSGKYTDSSHVYDNAGVGRVTSGTVSK